MSDRIPITVADLVSLVDIGVNSCLTVNYIKGRMAEYGYDEKSFAVVTKMSTDVKRLYEFKISSTGMQKEKTRQLTAARKAAERAVRDLTGILKAVYLSDKPMLVSLGIGRRLPARTNEFIIYSYTLFDNATNTTPIRERIAGRGYPAAKLAAERNKIVIFESMNKDQEIAKGATQQAQASKVKGVRKLYEWYIEFVRVAKVVFRDEPGYLEQMQIMVKITRAPRKKNISATSTPLGTSPLDEREGGAIGQANNPA